MTRRVKHERVGRLRVRAPHRVYFTWSVAAVTMVAAAFVLHRTLAATTPTAMLPRWAIVLAGVWAIGGALVWALGPGFGTSRPRFKSHHTARPRTTAQCADSAWPPSPARQALTIALCTAALSGISFVGGWVLLLLPLTRDAVIANVAAATTASGFVMLGIALCAGAAEEVFFRLGLGALTSSWVRWVLPNALYLVVTAASGNVVLTLAAPLVGVCATAAREFSAVWIAPLVVHAGWTLTMVGLFPFTVSGACTAP